MGGDAAQIRASYVRKQKTDQRDAEHILKLLLEGRFPRSGYRGEKRDLRQLLMHRHKLVQMRARVKNGLQHLALNQGCRGRTPVEQRDSRYCASCRWPWAARRREDLLALLACGRADRPLDGAVAEAAPRAGGATG